MTLVKKQINKLLNNELFSEHLQNELVNNKIKIVLGYDIYHYLKIKNVKLVNIIQYVFDSKYSEVEIKLRHTIDTDFYLEISTIGIHIFSDGSGLINVYFSNPSIQTFKLNLFYIKENDKFYVNDLNIKNNYDKNVRLEIAKFMNNLINKNEPYLWTFYFIITKIHAEIKNKK